jgi:hypothetical protein
MTGQIRQCTGDFRAQDTQYIRHIEDIIVDITILLELSVQTSVVVGPTNGTSSIHLRLACFYVLHECRVFRMLFIRQVESSIYVLLASTS